MSGSVWPALVAGARAKASEVESKFDWIEGDIVPMTGGTKTDATYDLGQSTFRFRDSYISRQYLGPAGSIALPTFGKQGEASGLYFPDVGIVGVALSGVEGTRFRSTGQLITTSGTNDAYVQYLQSSTSFSQGIDQSDSNKFKLAGSAALGTTDMMAVTTAGEITYPLQPCFFVRLSSTQSNVTGSGTAYTIPFDTELVDRNNDYSGSSFVAPVTGIYFFALKINVTGLVGGSHRTTLGINTATRSYQTRVADASTETTYHLTVLADMAAGETATTVINSNNGGTTVDIVGDTLNATTWAGFLFS